MAINATMGLKLPHSLWEKVTERSKAQGITTSAYINLIVTELRKDTEGLLAEGILHALKYAPCREDETTKSTSCCVEVEALQHLHDIALKLEMSREGVLRILIRYALAQEANVASAFGINARWAEIND